jgi:hypothetical protein
MKTFLPLHRAGFGVLLISALFAVTSSRAEDTSLWLAEKARPSGSGLLVPDTKGPHDLDTPDSTGITLGEKAPKGGDAKSFVMDGAQVAPLRSIKPIPSPVEGFDVELQVNVGDGAPDADTTLVRHGGFWELRYLANRSSVAFIVWHDANIFTEVRVPVKVGSWESVKAKYEGDRMEIQIGSEKAEAVPKDILFAGDKPQRLVLGASGPAPVDGVLSRAFTGALADIRFTVQ